MATVSVCIPAYGRPDELREAIRSALDQSFADLEVVVGDDSGDLEDAVRSVDDGRVRYVRNEVRLGMAANWTSTLDHAQGRYRALLMDDDRLLPGFLAAAVAALDADPTVGAAFTDHWFEWGERRWRRNPAVRAGRHDGAAFLRTLVGEATLPVAVSACLMRAEAWEHVRPLPDLLSADLVMYLELAERGWAFAYVDQPLMVYRVHGGQLTSREERFRGDLVKAWERFDFEDAACEGLRRQRLGRALVGRAATYVKAGRAAEAAADVARARSLGAGLGARERLVATVAARPGLQPAVRTGWRAYDGLRGRVRPVRVVPG